MSNIKIHTVGPDMPVAYGHIDKKEFQAALHVPDHIKEKYGDEARDKFWPIEFIHHDTGQIMPWAGTSGKWLCKGDKPITYFKC